MQYGENAEFAADELRVEADCGEVFHYCLDQGVVEQLLFSAHRVSQLRRDGEDQVEVAHR